MQHDEHDTTAKKKKKSKKKKEEKKKKRLPASAFTPLLPEPVSLDKDCCCLCFSRKCVSDFCCLL